MPAKKKTRKYTISIPLVFTLNAKDSSEARKVAGHLENYLEDAFRSLQYAYDYPIVSPIVSKSKSPVSTIWPIATIWATKSDKGT